jgi:hypothetical protein
METSLKLYHGSNQKFSHVDLSKSKDKRDFGKGFYLTTIQKQAEAWAKSLFNRHRDGAKYVYNFNLSISDTLKIKSFDGLSKEWLEFVILNRTKGGIQHDFDIVRGPIADDNTTRTIAFYVDKKSVEDTLEQLKFMRPNDQVSIHTEKALSYLTLLNWYYYVK